MSYAIDMLIPLPAILASDNNSSRTLLSNSVDESSNSGLYTHYNKQPSISNYFELYE